MRTKQAKKVKEFNEKPDVFKALKKLSQEKILRWGFENFNWAVFEIFYQKRPKFLHSTFFSRYADCQLGGGHKKMSA